MNDVLDRIFIITAGELYYRTLTLLFCGAVFGIVIGFFIAGALHPATSPLTAADMVPAPGESP